MKIKMTLLSDTIFGNGMSVPGGEDISILTDTYGFPYYKGSSFKGVFRDNLIKYLEWSGLSEQEIKHKVSDICGYSGDDRLDNENKIVFSNFNLSDNVCRTVINEIGNHPDKITETMTNIRTFTALEGGTVKDGSLRMARCVNKGIVFYSNVLCSPEDEELICDILGTIKWIGSMKNRGFGKVSICREECV